MTDTADLRPITGGTEKQAAYAAMIRNSFVDRIVRMGMTDAGREFLESLTTDAVAWIEVKSRFALPGDAELACELANDGAASDLWAHHCAGRVMGKYLRRLVEPAAAE
jgi:hypothetical protein